MICSGENFPALIGVISFAALFNEGFAVYTFGNGWVRFVCTDLNGFECAVVFVAHIEFAGSYIAMDTGILRHNKRSPFV